MTSSLRWCATALAAASVLALGAWAFASTQQATATPQSSATPARIDLVAMALAPSAAGADPLQVEPRIPRAAGTACVASMANDFLIPEQWYWSSFEYVAPANCPGPYSKITLVVELTGPREGGQPSSTLQMFLAERAEPDSWEMSPPLYVGAPQITDDIPVWRMERDVTELLPVFRAPLVGYFPGGTFDNYNHDGETLQPFVRSVKLLFYRRTASTPAQRSADVVLSLANPSYGSDTAFAPGPFPRNIERAYVDVYARANRFWWSCVPDDAMAASPTLQTTYAMGDARFLTASAPHGCAGGSYREVEVRVDGVPAGLAPVFPWLPSNINNNFRGTVDRPAPSVQALNMTPFRVDITPFAGVLNDGNEHLVELRLVGAEESFGWVAGQVLLYLDKGRSVVPGAVTRNTLAAQASVPVVTNGLVFTPTSYQGSSATRSAGQVDTRLARSFRIDGYVDTSRGRISTMVLQTSRFVNTQTIDLTSNPFAHSFVDYSADYLQRVRLSSTVDRTARRMLGSTMLSEDKLYSTYPLVIDYRHAGRNSSDGEFAGAGTDVFTFSVHQARAIRTSQYRRGTTRYETSMSDVFDGSHDYFGLDVGGTGEDTNWSSARRYAFTDNFGGCYRAALTTLAGVLDTRTRGVGCPNGNNLRWWSHPDGSPDSMNWAPLP